MANENLKKFLDSAGVSHLWTKINDKIDDKISEEAKRVDDKIGDIGEKTVKTYIDEKTEGLATSGVITDLQADVKGVKGRLDTAEGKISTIESDYVKSGDIADFETKVNVKKVSDALTQYQTDNDKALVDVKATADAAAAKTYVDKQLESKAGQAEFVEVQTLVNHFFAEEADVAKKLDQLVEIVEYLNNHEGAAADIVEDLAGLESKVNNLLNMGNDADGNEYAVAEYVQDKINARLDIGTKTVKEYVEGLLNITGQTVKEYVDTSIQSFVEGDYAQTVTNIGKLAERIGTLEEAVEAIQEVLTVGYITQSDMENYVNGRLGDMKDADGKAVTVIEYINALALTNAEIDTAIGATQQTN